MKKVILYFSVYAFCVSICFSQNIRSSDKLCNFFDNELNLLFIQENSLWEVGKPTKNVFNNSYNSDFSIVTGLDSLYANDDTSRFIVKYTDDGRIPNYLGIYQIMYIEFDHRFLTESLLDVGKIEISLDYGEKWVDLFDLEYEEKYLEQNYHYFESTDTTVNDSIVISGNSGGWVHSYFAKDITSLIDEHFPEAGSTEILDTIYIRYTFISDNAGRDEGWQIDNICISCPLGNNINRLFYYKKIDLYPNPSRGYIYFNNRFNGEINVQVFDIIGNKHKNMVLGPGSNRIGLHSLKEGIYIVRIETNQGMFISRIIKN